MIRKLGLISALLFASLSTGCSFEHAASVDYEHMPKTTKDGFTIVGYVHTETWTPAILYVFPILPFQNAEKARRLAFDKAKQALNADGITDLQLYTETHMWFFLFGWVENHASATAIATGS